MSEYVGERYQNYLNKKVFDKNGNVASYNGDKQVSINEYFIDKYLQKSLAGQVLSLIHI